MKKAQKALGHASGPSKSTPSKSTPSKSTPSKSTPSKSTGKCKATKETSDDGADDTETPSK
jgi:hypothetical protein